DLSGPVLRLQSLTPEDLMILLSNIRTVFASGDAQQHLVPDEALPAFMEHCNRHVGEAYFRTPRNTIKAFVQFLAVLEQNPGTQWTDLINAIEMGADIGAANGVAVEGEQGAGDDELASIR